MALRARISAGFEAKMHGVRALFGAEAMLMNTGRFAELMVHAMDYFQSTGWRRSPGPDAFCAEQYRSMAFAS